MYCPKCSAYISDERQRCPECGFEVLEAAGDMDKTMAIPVLGISEEPEEIKTGPEAETSNSFDLKKKLVVFAAAFLATLVLGAVIMLVIAMPKNGTKEKAETPVLAIQTEDKEEEKEIEIKEGKSQGKEEKEGIFTESNYRFAMDASPYVESDSYKTLNSTQYGYSCDVPSEFAFVYDDGTEIRYGAADKTAYMDIGAFDNDDSLTCREIKKMLASELGSSSDYEVDGDNWFVLRKVSEGIVHHFKCYVDDYVVYIEFAYPSSYSDVYDSYAKEIEQTFVRTN